MVIVPPLGAKVTKELTVKAPPTLKLTFDWEVGVAEMVSPENVSVPVFVMVHPVVAIVMVPPEAIKLPAETFKAAFILKLEEVVIVPVIVRPENIRVPVLVIVLLAPDIVIVPPLGDKFPPEIFKAAAMLKLDEVIVVPVTVKL